MSNESKPEPDATLPTQFNQFLTDYWIELRNHDPLLAMLTSWGVLSMPPKHKVRRLYRPFIVTILLLSSLGLPILLKCTGLSNAVVTLLTLIINTIPIEILNLIWIRLVKPKSELKPGKKPKRQYCLKFCGIILGAGVFSYSIAFCALSFGVDAHCSSDISLVEIVMLQFFVVPLFMCLPYWREQSVLLKFLGQYGPVVGLLMHVQVHGFRPPKKDVEMPETLFGQLFVIGIICILIGFVEVSKSLC